MNKYLVPTETLYKYAQDIHVIRWINIRSLLKPYINMYKIFFFYLYLTIHNRRKLITAKGPFMGGQVTIVSNHVNNLHKSTKWKQKE